MEKKNYDKLMQEIIEKNQELGIVPTLLLHTCCAPCSSAVIERLSKYFQITVFYYNPNIEPEEEYVKRKEEQKRYLKEVNTLYSIQFLDCDYDHKEFVELSKGLENAPEGGARCIKCYQNRLEVTALKAQELHFDYFGTSLTVSPYKNAQVLNQIGTFLSHKYSINYLYSDFKKRNGYKRSIELSKEHNLYRQDYCGCHFSKEERRKEKNGE
mgnify:FL=1